MGNLSRRKMRRNKTKAKREKEASRDAMMWAQSGLMPKPVINNDSLTHTPHPHPHRHRHRHGLLWLFNIFVYYTCSSITFPSLSPLPYRHTCPRPHPHEKTIHWLPQFLLLPLHPHPIPIPIAIAIAMSGHPIPVPTLLIDIIRCSRPRQSQSTSRSPLRLPLKPPRKQRWQRLYSI